MVVEVSDIIIFEIALQLRNLLFKMRGKNKQKGFLKMSKRPPKQSRDAEEMESMSLFDNSIPSGSRSSKVARVFDKEDTVIQSDDESEEDSSDNQPVVKSSYSQRWG
ncbi:hypothetical protein EB796_018867 [Bugula neritina]|uniref:Uncharacterized protein n=1 Tax=Bugula neritina TaxID=10212 RepID=A0A7J7JA05_BUGNE|nr:hypothetical protein EB796_018867 [Bugula neritina]